RRVFRVRRTEHRRAYPSATRWGGRVDGPVPHRDAPPCVAAPGSAPTSPPGPDTPTHSPRSHPLPVDIGGPARRVSPRSLAAPAPAARRWGGRVDGPVPHGEAPPCVAAPGSAPTSPPGPDPPPHSPRPHPLPVDSGGTERRVSPRSLAAPATAPGPAPSRSPGP